MKLINSSIIKEKVLRLTAKAWETGKRRWLTAVFAGIFPVLECSAQVGVSENFRQIAGTDSIYLTNPETANAYPVTGAIFNAVDPRFIANKHGFTKKEKTVSDVDGTFKKTVTKEFSLVAFDYVNSPPNYEGWTYYTSLNAQNKWNYYINDLLMPYEARALVSALMPQAIDRVEFISADTLLPVAAQMDLPSDSIPSNSRGSL